MQSTIHKSSVSVCPCPYHLMFTEHNTRDPINYLRYLSIYSCDDTQQQTKKMEEKITKDN